MQPKLLFQMTPFFKYCFTIYSQVFTSSIAWKQLLKRNWFKFEQPFLSSFITLISLLLHHHHHHQELFRSVVKLESMRLVSQYIKEIPEPVFSCFAYHSEGGRDQKRRRRPAHENWEGIDSFTGFLCCIVDSLEVGRCRGVDSYLNT